MSHQAAPEVPASPRLRQQRWHGREAGREHRGLPSSLADCGLQAVLEAKLRQFPRLRLCQQQRKLTHPAPFKHSREPLGQQAARPVPSCSTPPSCPLKPCVALAAVATNYSPVLGRSGATCPCRANASSCPGQEQCQVAAQAGSRCLRSRGLPTEAFCTPPPFPSCTTCLKATFVSRLMLPSCLHAAAQHGAQQCPLAQGCSR